MAVRAAAAPLEQPPGEGRFFSKRRWRKSIDSSHMFIQTVCRHPRIQVPVDVSTRSRLTAIQASLAARAARRGATPLTASLTTAVRRIRMGTPTAGEATTKAEAAEGSDGGRIE